MTLPTALYELAGRQHGALSRRQALRMIAPAEYDGHLRRGHLVRLQHGVAAVAGSEPSPQRSMMAAVLRAGDGARVTGPAVLGLFDVDGFSPADPFEVLVPAGRSVTRVDFAARVDPLPERDRAIFGELPIAKLPTALVDGAIHAPLLGDRRLRVAVDSACWKGLTTRDAVADLLDLLPPTHPGVAWFRRLDLAGELRAESEGERRLLRALRPVHPQPRRQAWITDRIRVDLLWERLRVVGEYLGWVDHAPEPTPEERHRRSEIERRGHLVIEYRASDLEQPDEVAARTQLVLVNRARELGLALA